MEGLLIALIILMKLFVSFVQARLMKKPSRIDEQVQFPFLNVRSQVLDMRLRRLTGLERDKINLNMMTLLL